jgi:hypothetical protein
MNLPKEPIAIVSSDESHYRDFLPISRRAWNRIGFGFFHAEVGGREFFAPRNLNIVLLAQIARLYASTLFDDKIVILSDIDMIPLSKKYFHSRLPTHNTISIYSSDAYRGGRYPVCYISAQSSLFKAILLDRPDESWEEFAIRLSSLRFGWDTDELYLTGRIMNSAYTLARHKRRWIKGIAIRRIDRILPFTRLIPYPIDFHCPRPFNQHSDYINRVLSRRLQNA